MAYDNSQDGEKEILETQRIDARQGSTIKDVTMIQTSGDVTIQHSDPALKPQAPFQAPPLPVQGVFGRQDDLKQIAGLLAFQDEAATNVPPVALRGMGGIGKTTLAIALARLQGIETLFPDGVLWTSLGPRPTVRLMLDS